MLALIDRTDLVAGLLKSVFFNFARTSLVTTADTTLERIQQLITTRPGKSFWGRKDYAQRYEK